MRSSPSPAATGGKTGNVGGGGDTQVLDGGTLPLGEPCSFIASVCWNGWCKGTDLVIGCALRLGSPASDSDETQCGGDDGALYDETQPVDEAETQLVDEVVVEEEEEEEEDVAGDWAETQLVESGEEDGGDDGDQVMTQLEVENGEKGDDDGGWTRTQLDEKCEVDGLKDGVGGMVETQLVEDSEEKEQEDGVNGGDEPDVCEWGKTQLVEDSDEEIGDDELSDNTQVLSDNESLSGDERGVKSGIDKRDVELGVGGSIEGLNVGVENLGDNKNLVESDASTDEEGDTVSG